MFVMAWAHYSITYLMTLNLSVCCLLSGKVGQGKVEELSVFKALHES